MVLGSAWYVMRNNKKVANVSYLLADTPLLFIINY